MSLEKILASIFRRGSKMSDEQQSVSERLTKARTRLTLLTADYEVQTHRGGDADARTGT